MREQLVKYVELLFAGTTDTYDIQQEILQNTLDKYDDLVAQGKSPEAAYRLAISGIGDVNEILGERNSQPISAVPVMQAEPDDRKRKLLRSIAIALYILCAVPIIITDGSNLGVCLTLLIVAVATAMIIIAGKSKTDAAKGIQEPANSYPAESTGRGIARSIIWGCGTCLYLCVSFFTGAWWITWLIFPILACVQGIVTAIFDLKEA